MSTKSKLDQCNHNECDHECTLQDDEQIQIHTLCGNEAQNLGEDGISYCEECGCCEGETEMVSLEEFEKRQKE